MAGKILILFSFVFNIIIDKNCCNTNAFIRKFTIIRNTLKVAKKNQLKYQLSMNKIISKFLLAGNKFMSDIYLRQPGFMYSACGLKETEDSR